jgi:predicted dehydrogenase
MSAKKASAERVFKTNRRIRLGIWGLGRGGSFVRACSALNLDVVAGCDFNETMLKRFRELVPAARLYRDAGEFLASDLDAVLLATHCPDHGLDAVRCLEAGKHVLSEVTAFHTPAEGVRLIETVERTGRIYNLAENYPFTKRNLYLADKWRQGLFGELIYAESEYNHDSRRPLTFAYITGDSVQPGHSLHAWRSWNHQHFYCTHSLGPVMHITGGRPVRVVSLPGANSMAANVPQVKASGMATIAPSLIRLDNGGLVRNFMGSTTNDTHAFRIWGTRGAAESAHRTDLLLRLGGMGGSPKMEVVPRWPELGELAERMGHGGGDFWVLYYFAREILTGEPAFWNVYRAADVTLSGILAYRSALAGGAPMDVPDLRTKEARTAWRRDADAQKPYNWRRGPFPRGADTRKLAGFTTVMKDLINMHATGARAVLDWLSVAPDVKEPAGVVEVIDRFIAGHADMKRTFAAARRMMNAYPKSDGATMIREMLDLADADRVGSAVFLARAKKERSRLKRLAGKKTHAEPDRAAGSRR